MNLLDILQIVIVFVGCWAICVLGFYYLFIGLIKAKNANVLIRVLYLLFLLVFTGYLLFFSPASKYMTVASLGFFIVIGIVILLTIFIVVSGVAAGSAKKGD